jgi:hypothetical protein
MALGYYRGRPLCVRLQRCLWRILKIFLGAFAAFGPAMPVHERRARTAVVQHESAGLRRK